MKLLAPARGIALAVALALPLAACGSSNQATTGTSGAPGAQASTQQSGIKLANCMRANGVPNFPDPTANRGGDIQIQQSNRAGSGPSTEVNGVAVNGPAFQTAMQKCHVYLPRGGHPPPGGLTAVKQKALRFSQCMRAHGVSNFPDPTVSSTPGGGVGIRIGGPSSGINPESPAFRSAQRACGSIIGKAPGPPAAS